MDKVVSDTGPILHLSEINLIKVFKIFRSISIPAMVAEELKKYQVTLPSQIKIVPLSSAGKDQIKVLANQYNLDAGESAAISLAIQEKSSLFLTDDLEARYIASKYNLKVHGTIGILLRAFREQAIDKKTALEKVDELHKGSSLFITADLVNQVKESINTFRKIS